MCFAITCIHFRITGYLNFGCDIEQEMPSDLFQFMCCIGSLGHTKSSVILKAHIITGCIITTKLGTKNRPLKAYLEDYLQNFGEKEFVSDEEIRLAEQYLIKVLYHGSKCISSDDLKVERYMHTLLNLPPTSPSIEGHILRYFNILGQQTTLRAERNHELKPSDCG